MELPSTPRRPSAVLAVLTVVAVVLLVAGSLPAGASSHDPKARRREVQKQRAAVASRIDVLKSSEEELERALDDLEGDVRGQEAQLAGARQAAAVALRQVEVARQAEAETAAHLASLRRSMRDIAVDAYIRGPARSMAAALQAGSLTEAVRRQQIFDAALGHGTELADQLRAASEDLGIRRTEVEAAEVAAVAERARAESRLSELKRAEDAKERVADGVEARLEAALAEADSLAALDSRLAAEIARRQQELARRLASRPGSGRGGGSIRVGPVSVTSVRGIVVNTSIAAAVGNLLEAAEADGLSFAGGGYRDSGDQVALRRAHCGSSDADIYEKPASRCRPPTARPGASMHEQGLAIDFTEGGSLITGRNSAGFRWLKANAAGYGLYNLPAEPWHWSTNGN